METVVLVLMVLVCFNFMLKQTWRKLRSVIVIAMVAALFTGMIWPFAIEQSKTQIADWLADTELMLDISVVLSIEVVVQMSFCMLAVHISSSGRLKRRTVLAYRILRWFPGLLVFPVLFCILVTLIFSFPGVSFPLVAWSMAAGVLVLIPAGSLLLRHLLPEKEVRLEVLFLTNAMIAVLGIIATVNGRTAVDGISTVDWGALFGITVLTLAGGILGWTGYLIKNNKRKSFNHKP